MDLANFETDSFFNQSLISSSREEALMFLIKQKKKGLQLINGRIRDVNLDQSCL